MDGLKKFVRNARRRVRYWEREVSYWSKDGLGHWPPNFAHAYERLQEEQRSLAEAEAMLAAETAQEAQNG